MEQRALGLVLALGILSPILMVAQAPGKKPPPAPQAKFKAIWEPVNVKEDVELTSVHFTSADEGWVSGGTNAISGGVILHTADGGATWETQLGEPGSADRAYNYLQFLDAKTGFAVQSIGSGDHRLLRTTDGKTWAPAGGVAQHRSDYQFVSPEIGFVAAGSQILRTSDAGKKWSVAYDCRVKAEVQGLTREVACDFSRLFFLDASSGFAIGRQVGDAGLPFARTSDGGTTWSLSLILPGEEGKEGALHFLDPSTGLLRTINGKIFRTSDGGRTWSGVPGEIGGKPDFEFADSEVGWAARYRTVIYTSDGGRRWLSREVSFPTSVNASSLPARDRGYVTGEHGMVYRYRVVPMAYTAKGMLPAAVIAAPSSK